MSKAIWRHSRAKGTALTVHLALATFLIKERLKAGHDPVVWPSHATLADMCNCSRSTVRIALRELIALGEIRDTDERGPRGVVQYELLLAEEAGSRPGGNPSKEADSRPGAKRDLADSRSEEADLRPRGGRSPATSERRSEDRREAKRQNAAGVCSQAGKANSNGNGNGDDWDEAVDATPEQEAEIERLKLKFGVGK